MNLKKIVLLIIPIVFVACGGDNIQREAEPVSESINYKEKFVNESNCSKIIDNEFIVMCYDYQKKAVKAVSINFLEI